MKRLLFALLLLGGIASAQPVRYGASLRLIPQASTPSNCIGNVCLFSDSTNSNHPTLYFSGAKYDALYTLGGLSVATTAPTANQFMLFNNSTSMWTATDLYPLVTGEIGVTSKLYPIGDVRRYGAKCDGTPGNPTAGTDDFTAFWNADQSMAAIGNAAVLVPPTQGKACRIGSPMNLLNARIVGAGKGVSAIQYGIASGTTLFSTVNTTSPAYISIENLSIVGPGTGTPNARGIDFINCSHCSQSNVEISAMTYYGTFLQRSSDVHLDNLDIHEITQASQAGIGGNGIHVFLGNSRVTITSPQIRNVDGDGIWVNAGTTHGDHVANQDINIVSPIISNFGADGFGHAAIGIDGGQRVNIVGGNLGPATNPTTQQTDGILVAENQGQIASNHVVVKGTYIHDVGFYCFEVRSTSHIKADVKCNNIMQAATALSATAYGIVFQDAVVLGPGAGCTPSDCTGAIFDSTDNLIDATISSDNSSTLTYVVGFINQTQNTYRNVVWAQLDGIASPTTLVNTVGANTPITGANANKLVMRKGNMTLADGTASNVAGAIGMTVGSAIALTSSTATIFRICSGDPDNGGTCPINIDKNGSFNMGALTSASGVVEAAVLWALKAIRVSVANAGSGINNTDYTAASPQTEILFPFFGLTGPHTLTDTCPTTIGSFGNTTLSAQYPAIIHVFDKDGTASSSNTISFKGSNTQSVDGGAAGASKVIIRSPRGSAWLSCDGTGWTTVETSGDGTLQGVNVASTTPTDTQVLQYVNANSDWEPKTVGITINAPTGMGGWGAVNLGGTLSPMWSNESANVFFAGPTTGAATTPTWRALVIADLPTAIPNANLANSSFTINAPTGMGGWGSVSLGGSLSPTWSNENANVVFAGPTSGGAATPTWRSLVAADIPSLSATYCALTGCTMSGALTLTFGGSTGTGIAGGTPFSSATPVNSVTTGETTAQTWTMAASMLNTDGDSLRCIAGFTHAANTDVTNAAFYFNGTAYVGFNGGNVSSGLDIVNVQIVRTSSSTATLFAWYVGAAGNTATSFGTGGQQAFKINAITGLTWTNSMIIKTTVTGATTNGDLTGNFLKCGYDSH